MSTYLEESKTEMEEWAKQSPVKMKIDRRRSKEKMLLEFEKLLSQNATIATAKKKNPWAMYENSYQAGRAEALSEARAILTNILKYGK